VCPACYNHYAIQIIFPPFYIAPTPAVGGFLAVLPTALSWVLYQTQAEAISSFLHFAFCIFNIIAAISTNSKFKTQNSKLSLPYPCAGGKIILRPGSIFIADFTDFDECGLNLAVFDQKGIITLAPHEIASLRHLVLGTS